MKLRSTVVVYSSEIARRKCIRYEYMNSVIKAEVQLQHSLRMCACIGHCTPFKVLSILLLIQLSTMLIMPPEGVNGTWFLLFGLVVFSLLTVSWYHPVSSVARFSTEPSICGEQPLD